MQSPIFTLYLSICMEYDRRLYGWYFIARSVRSPTIFSLSLHRLLHLTLSQFRSHGFAKVYIFCSLCDWIIHTRWLEEHSDYIRRYVEHQKFYEGKQETEEWYQAVRGDVESEKTTQKRERERNWKNNITKQSHGIKKRWHSRENWNLSGTKGFFSVPTDGKKAKKGKWFPSYTCQKSA